MTDCSTTSSRDRYYKWLLVGLLAVTYFLMHGSRQVFNASLPQIKADLAGHGVTDSQLGLSRTFFLFAYGCMVPFAGIASDFFRRKWVIVIGTLLFSTSVFFTGFADSMLMFFIMYGFLNGIGEFAHRAVPHRDAFDGALHLPVGPLRGHPRLVRPRRLARRRVTGRLARLVLDLRRRRGGLDRLAFTVPP